MFRNTAKEANGSALVYRISETAKLNKLRPDNYFKYALTELPKHSDEEGNIEPTDLCLLYGYKYIKLQSKMQNVASAFYTKYHSAGTIGKGDNKAHKDSDYYHYLMTDIRYIVR